jgi:hypothetical protein
MAFISPAKRVTLKQQTTVRKEIGHLFGHLKSNKGLQVIHLQAFMSL